MSRYATAYGFLASNSTHHVGASVRVRALEQCRDVARLKELARSDRQLDELLETRELVAPRQFGLVEGKERVMGTRTVSFAAAEHVCEPSVRYLGPVTLELVKYLRVSNACDTDQPLLLSDLLPDEMRQVFLTLEHPFEEGAVPKLFFMLETELLDRHERPIRRLVLKFVPKFADLT